MIRRPHRPVRVAAPAKLNLYLHIVGRRPNGYHELDSLIAFAELHDTIQVEPADNLSLHVSGPFARALDDAGGENLVERAARALADAFTMPAAARVSLHKRLPVAAGIGGGSADAAATLRALVELWNIDADERQLVEIAQKLGADVPVCLNGRAAQIGGIGEIISPVPSLPSCGLLLVNPGVHLATPDVFGARHGPFSEPCHLSSRLSDVGGMADALRAAGNDLEEPARSLVPQVGDVLTCLQEMPDCLLARMSGSGATCFGLFDDQPAAQDAARALKSRQRGWWISATTLCDDVSKVVPAAAD